MAKKVAEKVQSVKKTISRVSKHLQEAKNVKEALDRQIKNARARLQRRRSESGKFSKDVEKLVTKYKSIVKDTLIKNIREAADRSDEFYITAYKAPLFSVAQDDSIYKFIISGSLMSTDVTLMIDFETEAGNLNDYSRGVTRYRKTLKVKEGKSPKGRKATFYWFNQVYGTAQQNEAVSKRVGFSGRKAPFWEILNFGSPSSMASDRSDGSFNPLSQSPTNFIENTRQDVSLDLKLELTGLKVKWAQEVQNLREEIEEAEERRRLIVQEINRLTPDDSRNQKIYESFGEKKRYVDSKKLEAAIAAMDAGDSRSRIEVSKNYSKNRVYLTLGRLEGSIE